MATKRRNGWILHFFDPNLLNFSSVLLLFVVLFSNLKTSFSEVYGGHINLRNIDLASTKRKLGGGITVDSAKEGYSTDTRQDFKPYPGVAGVKIQQESQKLSSRFRWLSNEEIGIVNMQVRLTLMSKWGYSVTCCIITLLCMSSLFVAF